MCRFSDLEIGEFYRLYGTDINCSECRSTFTIELEEEKWGRYCGHLNHEGQTLDVFTFISEWNCPVCNQKISQIYLRCDGGFTDDYGFFSIKVEVEYKKT